MIVTPSEGSYTDVVVTATWTCTASQLVNNTAYSVQVTNSTPLPSPSGSFTPYSQLTQDQVLSWVWASGVNKAATEAQVNATLQNQIVTALPLPWAQ